MFVRNACPIIVLFVQGTLAYVPQQSWILNDTVRGNILFTQPYDAERYRQIIIACALEPDLEILPASDLTEIGERVSDCNTGAFTCL